MPSIEPATDDWPFLYMRDRHIPRHYLVALAADPGGVGRRPCCWRAARAERRAGRGSSSCSAPASCCSRRSRSSSSRCCGARPGSSASLAIASVLTMALAGERSSSSRVEIRRPWLVGGRAGRRCWRSTTLIPVGRVAFDSRAAESLFYAVLVFSPILCAGLLFGSAIKRFDVAGARLRHQPARRDGRRRGGIPVAGDRLPLPAAGGRGVLYRRRADEAAEPAVSTASGSLYPDG